MDWSTELIDNIVTDLDVRGVVGHGSHPDVLERAGAGEADLIVAVTHSDETNMIACQVAHSLFETPMRIARVRAQNYLDPAWADLFTTGNLPINEIISPELEVGRAILQRMETLQVLVESSDLALERRDDGEISLGLRLSFYDRQPSAPEKPDAAADQQTSTPPPA